MSKENYSCLICDAGHLIPQNGYPKLSRVTSDCRGWRAGGVIAICDLCYAVQKPLSSSLKHEINKIYQTYDINPWIGGADQAAFLDDGTTTNTRTQKLAKFVLSKSNLAAEGELLDIGCGSGTALKSFGEVLPKWSLSGAELSNYYEERLKKIENFQELYTNDISKITKKFDLVLLIHTLEHLFAPQPFLEDIKKITTSSGILFIQVPNLVTAPFDILIADHIIHFTVADLVHLVKRAGWSIVSVSENEIKKEISMICNKTGNSSEQEFVNQNKKKLVASQINWLNRLVETSIKKVLCAKNRGKKIGIFGTANASAWLTESLDLDIDFYVDEDSLREDTVFAKKPVFSPNGCPSKSCIIIPLPSNLASRISKQYQRDDIEFILPSSEF